MSWVDSHPVTYTNWDLDYPKTTMECAILSENNLKWRDERCDESHPVICKHFMGKNKVIDVTFTLGIKRQPLGNPGGLVGMTLL